ncbi:sigma factor-like helix-turn-helix DNA-binding protein [Viridibacillus arvi]|uniref:sigma factor-like helix-turn-helix DNA-binding protein n=1 Tax=Viridibacillus arvi TaxID=263475 RepID=UPI0034D0199C
MTTKQSAKLNTTIMKNKKRGPNKKLTKRPWSREDDSEILELRYTDNLTLKEIAEKTNRTWQSISARLVRIREGTNGYIEDPWTSEQIEILYTSIGVLDFKAIGKKLNRSAKAVESKAATLGIENTSEMSGLITVHQLSKILQVDSKTIYRWVDTYDFPVKRLKLREPDSRGNNYVSVTEFWKWAEEHKERINWFKVERLVLIPEPHWVDECRKIDYYKKPTKRRWTRQEDRKVWTLYYTEELTHKEIAKIMEGRSVQSIEKRLRRLRENNFGTIMKIYRLGKRF